MVTGSFLENGLELEPWTQKRIFWAFETRYFSVFCNFSSDEVETIFWENEAKHSKYLNQNLVIRSFLENGFEATLSSITNVLSVWKGYFSVFCNFLSNEVGKVRQIIKNYVNQNLVIGSFLENGLEFETWTQKQIFWAFETRHFSVFCNFSSDAVETIF